MHQIILALKERVETLLQCLIKNLPRLGFQCPIIVLPSSKPSAKKVSKITKPVKKKKSAVKRVRMLTQKLK